MPQPKTARSEAEPTAATREQLARLLNPLDLVLLTRERIQAILDEAVERGRMTRGDAADLATALVERGRRQTDDLLADVEQLLGRSRDQLDDASSDLRRRTRQAAGSADRVLRGLGSSFPIAGYDELTAAQVSGRLGELTPAELRRVRDYEKRNANRKSVLAAIEQKLA
jgi:polyhydroxyalkanoate synthesis regulator phasin